MLFAMNVNISNELKFSDVYLSVKFSGPSCSKLTTSLVNVLLKFQMLIS